MAREHAVPVTHRQAYASEVKTKHDNTPATATTKETVLTPTADTRIRVISVALVNEHATLQAAFEVYFGTGANITTTPAKAIHYDYLDAVDGGLSMKNTSFVSWPDGAGPVGGYDEVISLRCGADVDLLGTIVITYREETDETD